MSTSKNALSQQSIRLSTGYEITRNVRDITGDDEQRGTVHLHGGATIPVYRTKSVDLVWQINYEQEEE